MSKFSYLFDQSFAFLTLTRRVCPNCGCERSRLVDRKYIVSELRLCADCLVNFRWPCDRRDTVSAVYQDLYEQPGLTTDLPNSLELTKLKSSSFRGSEKDFGVYVSFLRKLFSLRLGEAKILDYGANWGYLLYQLREAGFANAFGYEISSPRREYGEVALDVSYIDSPEKHEGQFDCVISTHVIEHVPRPSQMLQDIYSMLAPGGCFILECPNGSLGSSASPSWGSQWGQIHPFYISDSFLLKSLSDMNFSGLILDKFDFIDLCSSDKDQNIGELLKLPLCSRLPMSSTLVFAGVKSTQ